jgi:hypothetical protein
MANYDIAEIASVGNEGMLGLSVFLGTKAQPKQAIVRTVGYGYRLKARLLLEEFNRGEALQNMLLRYTQMLISQASQTAVCNRYHSVEQKLSRWLLLNVDRLSTIDSLVTHELLANSLGIRQEVIIDALRKMRDGGLISYHGGPVMVLNRQGLEKQACECYGMIKSKSENLILPGVSKPKHESVRLWPKEHGNSGALSAYGGAF